MTLPFAKVEGLGNDFVLVDDPGAVAAIQAATVDVRRLCDRHLGVGADGVLLTGVDPEGPFLRIINADGSVPEMCGNGLRCAALQLRRRGRIGDEAVVRTDAGPHRVQIRDLAEGQREGTVEVWMRAPSLQPADLPLASPRPWRDHLLSTPRGEVRLTAVSMGNPHLVTFDPVAATDREALGPHLAAHPLAPEGANVGFARLADGRIQLAVHERGVGWTRACGTGACAAAVAAVETGRADRGQELGVDLPGGALRIRVQGPEEPVRMTGPARIVFEGWVA
ncbi:MAG: diaminopimelate epimerase [Sandaracinaceae bacterium]